MNDRLLTESSDADTGDDTYTVYSYGNATGTAGGDATQQTGKKVWEGLNTSGDVIESTTYAFNLQGRLAEATIVKGGDTTVLEYTYDDSGIRVGQTETVNAGTPVVHEYLVDANNPTGYQQVLEEIIDAVLARSYTLGLDVIAQANAGTPVDDYFLLYDAHGSTRALLDALAAVAQTYAYDAYGNALGFDTAAALTNLLYSGEQYDQKLAMQYLRARYYDAGTGRFSRMDDFFGLISISQSLHKYAYTHNNPVNGTDPTGLFLGKLLETLATVAVLLEIAALHAMVWVGIHSTAVYAVQWALAAYFLYQFVTDQATRDFVLSQPNPHLIVFGAFQRTPFTPSYSAAPPSAPINAAGRSGVTTIQQGTTVPVHPKTIYKGVVRVDGSSASLGGHAYSHETIAARANVLVSNPGGYGQMGELAKGYRAFTVFIENGNLVVMGSPNFGGVMGDAALTDLVLSFFTLPESSAPLGQQVIQAGNSIIAGMLESLYHFQNALFGDD